jgi:hypothetical protein
MSKFSSNIFLRERWIRRQKVQKAQKGLEARVQPPKPIVSFQHWGEWNNYVWPAAFPKHIAIRHIACALTSLRLLSAFAAPVPSAVAYFATTTVHGGFLLAAQQAT